MSVQISQTETQRETKSGGEKEKSWESKVYGLNLNNLIDA